MPDPRQGQPRTNKRQCGIQPAHQSLITDVFRSRPLLCTIHRLINFTLVSVENVPVVPAVLDKGHQSKRTRRAGGRRFRVGPRTDIAAARNKASDDSRLEDLSTGGSKQSNLAAEPNRAFRYYFIGHIRSYRLPFGNLTEAVIKR